MMVPAARSTKLAGRRSSATASPVMSSSAKSTCATELTWGWLAMPSFKQMDLDAYSAAHRDEWERLARLGSQRTFTGAEADELIDRYQSGASQLSAIKTTAGQSVPGDTLSLH